MGWRQYILGFSQYLIYTIHTMQFDFFSWHYILCIVLFFKKSLKNYLLFSFYDCRCTTLLSPICSNKQHCKPYWLKWYESYRTFFGVIFSYLVHLLQKEFTGSKSIFLFPIPCLANFLCAPYTTATTLWTTTPLFILIFRMAFLCTWGRQLLAFNMKKKGGGGTWEQHKWKLN